jgi:hypothetical protein
MAFRQAPGGAVCDGGAAVSANQPSLLYRAASTNQLSWARSEFDLCAAAAATQRRYIAVAFGGEVQGEAHHDRGAIQNRCQQTSLMGAEIAIQAAQCPWSVGTDGAQRRLGILLRQLGKISP